VCKPFLRLFELSRREANQTLKVTRQLALVRELRLQGDVVANSLLEFGVKRIKRGHPFAKEELDLITSMNTEIMRVCG